MMRLKGVRYGLNFRQCYYTIDPQGHVDTLWRLPPDWKDHATREGIDKLVEQAMARSLSKPGFETAEVLFEDNFDDGSVAGWTFLEGAQTQRLTAALAGDSLTRSMVYRYGAESWASPNYLLNSFQDGVPVSVKVPRDPSTGLHRLPYHDKTLIEIGVVNGRLRLRCASLYRVNAIGELVAA